MLRILFPLLLLFSACAHRPSEPKLRFSEVFRAPEQLAPPREPHATRQRAAEGAAEAHAAAVSLELQAALIAFAHRARQHRSGELQPGDPMSSAQIRNWDAVMTAVDELLRRPPRETSSYDVVRARVTLEAELELDVRRYDGLTEELLSAVELRMARLGFRMAELRRLKLRPNVLQPDFIWPVSPVAVTSLFGPRLHPIAKAYRPHRGLDLAASFGQEVYASARGTVLKAEWVGGHGNHVQLQHANGIVTAYSHLADLLVEAGTVVRQGQPIGLAGSTGVSTGVHLHFELWVNGKPADPLEQLAAPAERPRPVAAR